MALSNYYSKSRQPIQEIYQLAQQVLIVDSSPVSVKLIADEIIDLNHSFLGSAGTIEEIEEAITNREPDVIFINSHLTGRLSGFQIAKILKLDYDIPFYMICAENDCETQKWMGELNPDGFIYLTHSARPLSLQLSEILH